MHKNGGIEMEMGIEIEIEIEIEVEIEIGIEIEIDQRSWKPLALYGLRRKGVPWPCMAFDDMDKQGQRAFPHRRGVVEEW